MRRTDVTHIEPNGNAAAPIAGPLEIVTNQVFVLIAAVHKVCARIERLDRPRQDWIDAVVVSLVGIFLMLAYIATLLRPLAARVVP